MIPFFRKIRKQLADDNRPLKYARYAIGEIVLVVIGILIALQINTWNNEQIDKRKEQSLLKGLHKTFQDNLDNLNYVIDDSRVAFDSSKKLLSMLGPNASGYSDSEVDSLLSDIINYTTYDPSTGVIDEIINSGKLNIIQNKTLKENISSWSGMLTDANKDIEIANDHTFNVLLIYLNKKANLKNLPKPQSIIDKTGMELSDSSNFPSDYDEFMTDKELENLIEFHALNFIYLTREYLEIKEYLEYNISLMEADISE
ncbi:hypothetical protein LCM02_04945 [Lutimonas saemankumensis]|uniref:DUF6090 family protein n=1 Tax=Lutimonas saemankumensis TaxID=483016 RepID=UPI001CD569D4|nr:DUF6090 family protein [Lutimonas saemankumensis]MCA0931789.1 hypothetical protein [Lutimonas saemankumensis]